MSTTYDQEFVDFVTAERPALERAARLLTAGDPDRAEDVVQTALYRLYRRWSRVRTADHVRGYARTTLVRTYVDSTRVGFWRRERPTADLPDQPVVDRAPTDPDTRAVVLGALRSLGARQRAVVVLRHWYDLDVTTTAQILGCSEGTVKSQTARALTHLRDTLEPHLDALEIH
ncbi:MAG TPA: SigE family RNA polymerase sigma factor [Marmoricola sp.]